MANPLHPDAQVVLDRLNQGNGEQQQLQQQNQRLVVNIDPLRYINKIRTFNGKREELPNFIKQIDLIAPIMQRYDDNSQEIFITAIRAKLIERAQQVLDIHPHIITWNEIKTLLMSNFSSYKSIEQMYKDLRAIRFRGDILGLYNEIQRTLGLLNQKCIQTEGNHLIEGNIQTALKVFTRSISEPMKTILAARNPITLDIALNILTEGGYLGKKLDNESNNNIFRNSRQTNQNQRNFQNHNQNHQNFNQNPRNTNENRQNPNQNHQNLNPSSSNENRNQNHQNFNQRNFFVRHHNRDQNPRNFYRTNYSQQPNNNSQTQQPNNNFQKPEPMEVDQSTQMRRMNNYMENDQKQQNESNLMKTIENFPLVASTEISHT